MDVAQNFIKGIIKRFQNGGESASGDTNEEKEEEMSQSSRNQRTSKESDFIQLLPSKSSSSSVSSKAVIERLKESADSNESVQSPTQRQQIVHTIVLEAIMEMSKDNVPLLVHSKPSLKITSDQKMRLHLSKDLVPEVRLNSFKYYCNRNDNGQRVVIHLSSSSSPQQFVLWTEATSEWSILKKYAKNSPMEEKDYKKYCELRRCLESAASSKPKPRRSIGLSDVFEDIDAPVEAFDTKSKIFRRDEPIFTSRLRDMKETQPAFKRNKRKSQKDARHGRMDSHVVFDLSNEGSDDGSDTEDVPTPPRSSSSKVVQVSKTATSQQNPLAQDRVDSKYFPTSKPTQSTSISPLSASLPSSRSSVNQVKKTSVPSSLNFNQAHHEDADLTGEPKRSPVVRAYGRKPFESRSSSSVLYRSDASSAFSQVSNSQRVMSSSSSSLGSSSLASLAHALPTTTTAKKEVVDIAHEDDEEVTHVPGAKAATSLQRDPSLRTQRDRVVLTYPPGTLDSVTITAGDMDKLSNEAFINDSLLDFYLKHLQMNHDGAATSKVHVFTSFLYSRLVDLLAKSSSVLSKQFGREPTTAESWLHAYSQLWRWTAGVSLFEKMVIVFPINSGLHWSLAACVMSLDDNPDNCRGKILTFDSMTHSSHDPEMIAKTIRRYLDHEFHFRIYLCSEPKAREVKSNKVSVNANGEEEDDDFEPEVVDSSTVSRRDEMGLSNLYDTKVAETFTAKKFPLQRIKVAEQKDGFNCGLHLLWNFDLLLHIIDFFGSEPEYDMLLGNHFVEKGLTTAHANNMRETIRTVVQDEIKNQNAGVKSSTSPSSSSPAAAVAASGSSSSGSALANVAAEAHQDSTENIESSTLPRSSRTDSGKAELTEQVEASEAVIETQDDENEGKDNAVDKEKMLSEPSKASIEEKAAKDLEMEDSTTKVDDNRKENKEEKGVHAVKSLEEKGSKVNSQLRSTKRLEMEDSTASTIKEETFENASIKLKSRSDLKQNPGSTRHEEDGQERSRIKQDLPHVDAEEKVKESGDKVAEGTNDPSSVTLSFESQTARNAVKASGSKRLKMSTKHEEQEAGPVPLVVDDLSKVQEEKEFPLPIDDDGIA